MADPFLTGVTVTEGNGGICYRFPPRSLGTWGWIGVAGMALGLAACGLPLVCICMLIRSLVPELSAESGWFWLLATIATLVLAPLGLKLALLGLFIRAGHSEIELRRHTLAARECWGPLRWVWRRDTKDLRRFLVSESLGPLHGTHIRDVVAAVLNVLLGRHSGLGVIIPEWKAAVGGSRVPPLWLAPGYPRSRLRIVADDLARRCTSVPEPATAPEAPPPADAICTPLPAFPISPTIPAPPPSPPASAAVAFTEDPTTAPAPPPSRPSTSAPAPPRIEVVEQAADLSQYEELGERPAGSRIVMDTSPDGLTFIVPAAGWEANPGWVIGGVLAGLLALGLSLSLCGGAHSVGEVVLLVLGALAAWVLALGLLLVATHRARCRVVLDVTAETLVIWQAGLFRVRPRRWSRQQLADVFVMHYLRDEGSEGAPDRWELQIHPRPGHGPAHRLLAHRDPAELRWLATLLRRTLHCPGTSLLSPPRGFIVRSPGLVEHWHKQRPTSG
jgi:hypothetical protein